jgi:hypothetical protein
MSMIDITDSFEMIGSKNGCMALRRPASGRSHLYVVYSEIDRGRNFINKLCHQSGLRVAP